MRHIVLLCYVFTIIIGVAGLTIQWLSRKNHLNASGHHGFIQENAINYFMVALLTMNLYDALIYYSDYIITGFDNLTLLKIGDCIIAIIVFLWLEVEQKLVGKSNDRWIQKLFSFFMPFYFLVWMIGAFIASQFVGDGLRWFCAIVDIGLIVILIGGSAHYIKEEFAQKRGKARAIYMAIVTLMMLINYGSYFISEISVRLGGNSFYSSLVDLTVMYWFVINIANAIVMYKYIFKPSFASEPAAEFDLEIELNKLQKEFDLTNRERELAKLIYNGKSNGEIAKELFISESTVKTHVYNIFRKLGAKNRIEVVCLIRGDSIEEHMN